MGDLIYYLNGSYVPADQAALSMNDLGIVRGYGVFDLLRTYGSVPFRLHEHIQRLESSAQQIGLDLPWSTAELEAIVQETYERNGRMPDATIRIVVTGGPSDNFMTPQGNPSLAVMIHPVAPYPDHYFTDGCKATTTRIERIMPTVKSLNYIGAIMAVTEASKVGAVEAIYRDGAGHLTEGTRANLFAVRDGRVITPREGVLGGITRRAVLDAIGDAYEVDETSISYQDLPALDEAFLTSTTKEVLPVVQIDEQIIGSGKPGPHTLRILELFRTYVRAIAEEIEA